VSSKFARAAAAAKEALLNSTSESRDSSQSDNQKRQAVTVQADNAAQVLALDLIDVEVQVRRSFDEEFIKNLAANIKEHGQLQAVNVTKIDNGRYRLTSGENRFRAMCYLRKRYPANPLFQTIRATIDYCVDETDRFVKQFHENVQRKSLNVVDEAKAIARLRDALGLKTEREIASALHIPQKRVNRRLKILKQPEAVQLAIVAGDISLRDLESGNVEIVDGLVVNQLGDLSSSLTPQSQSASSNNTVVRKQVAKKKNNSPNISLPFSTVEDMVSLLASLAKDKGLAPIDVPQNAKAKDLAVILNLRLNDIKGAVDA